LQISPSSLTALLGASYAENGLLGDLQHAHAQDEAKQFCYRYLCINPWDAKTQTYYSFLLCRSGQLEQAFAHARSAEMLRPSNASALILVLNYQLQAKKWGEARKIAALLKDSKDPDASNIVKLLNYQAPIENLLGNAVFEEIVNKATLSAEDPENGYKMLGEP
jgi:hypothetical protein